MRPGRGTERVDGAPDHEGLTERSKVRPRILQDEASGVEGTAMKTHQGEGPLLGACGRDPPAPQGAPSNFS